MPTVYPEFDVHDIPFVEMPKESFQVCKSRKPQLIVFHCMEAPEKGNTAESVANYFKNGAGGRNVCTHYCGDNNSIVQCVQCKDICYGAPGLNKVGIHYEIAGYSRQSFEDWHDEYSQSALRLAAKLCAEVLCPKFRIPPRILTIEELQEIGEGNTSIRGFCTHAMGTEAFKVKGGHTDPGTGFPFIEVVKYIEMLINYPPKEE